MSEPVKRLTIDIPESLHRTIKVQTALRGTKMVDEVRALLEAHFRPEGAATNFDQRGVIDSDQVKTGGRHGSVR